MTRIVFLREGGGEQMFRDVEFLPEMLKPDKAVYELLGVNFENVAVYSTSSGCWVKILKMWRCTALLQVVECKF